MLVENTSDALVEHFYRLFDIEEESLSIPDFTFKTIRSRSMLFEQGQRANKLYFVLEGKVLLGRNLNLPNEQVVDLIMGPCVMGLDALQPKNHYTNYARALTELKLLEIDGKLFNSSYSDNIQLHNLIRNQLSNRLINANEKYVQLYSNASFFDRMKHFLTDVFLKYGERKRNSIVVQIHITHKELAQYIHASRQSISSLLSNLRKAGIINYNRSEIEVYSLDKLKQWDFERSKFSY